MSVENENDESKEINTEDSAVTMLDVLAHEQQLEKEYAAVLGASDENCCTYSKGHIKRQALYSCLTCCPEARNNLERCAGVCLACSNKCHENHELVELYTKRNFRCDCPTERMGGSNRCALNEDLGERSQPLNSGNLYNHNFQGLYCICHRPYPDPEEVTDEVMLQCVVCEDWYHLQHLDVPTEFQKLEVCYNEMICGACMQKYAFLQSYTGLALKVCEDADESVANSTITDLDASVCVDDIKLKSDLDKSISEIMNIGNESEADKCSIENNYEQNIANGKNTKTGLINEGEEPSAKRLKLDSDLEQQSSTMKEACRLPKGNQEYKNGAVFWKSDWRTALCQCSACLQVYKASKLEFLLDAEDSAKFYEERGMKRAATESSSYEQGMQALASIGRVQQIDAISEYNRMKKKLMGYLQTFAASKKVVTEEDINRFFDEMRNEKNASLGQPFFCR